MTIITNQNEQIRVIFHGIDTLEKKQAFGQQPKKRTISNGYDWKVEEENSRASEIAF